MNNKTDTQNSKNVVQDSKDDHIRDHTCEYSECKNVAKLQCPICPKLHLAPTYFCSRDCFKKMWPLHNKLHKDCESFTPPKFQYTGNLRPHYVTPIRNIPEHIIRPDYSTLENNSKITIYNEDQISHIRVACKLARRILDMATQMIKPGVSPDMIDKAIHNMTIEHGAYPSTMHYRGYNKSCCISVNEVICHGIPDCRPLQHGDIVNIDLTIYYNGYHADLSETHPVGDTDHKSKDLIKTAYDSLMLAIAHVKPNQLVRKLGDIIENYVRKHNYSVVRSYCGHGIGKTFHAAPTIPHYGKSKAPGILKQGMVFTIEPMINMGKWQDKTWPDGWTVVTEDGQRSAQFEHTMVVTHNNVEILTARTSDSLPFWWENK